MFVRSNSAGGRRCRRRPAYRAIERTLRLGAGMLENSLSWSSVVIKLGKFSSPVRTLRYRHAWIRLCKEFNFGFQPVSNRGRVSCTVQSMIKAVYESPGILLASRASHKSKRDSIRKYSSCPVKRTVLLMTPESETTLRTKCGVISKIQRSHAA